MQFIQGQDREQSVLFTDNLDGIVADDNEVRIIDLFVESINITDFKFVIKTTAEGRPAYHPKDLLKLYVYGYLNSIAPECKIEIPVSQKLIQYKKLFDAGGDSANSNESSI